MTWVAAAELKGYVYCEKGLDPERLISTYHEKGSVSYCKPPGTFSNKSIQNLLETKMVDRYFLA